MLINEILIINEINKKYINETKVTFALQVINEAKVTFALQVERATPK